MNIAHSAAFERLSPVLVLTKAVNAKARQQYNRPRILANLSEVSRERVVHVAYDTFGYISAKARLKERNSAFHRRTALCIKSIERGFVEAFSHASSHLRIDSGLELRRVRPSRLDKNRSMCLKSVFGPMKDEVGLSVVVNGAMYERIQSLLHRPPMRMH